MAFPSNPSASAPNNTPVCSPVAVVGPQFCAPYPVDLTVKKKLFTISDGGFTVTDVNGTAVFEVKGTLLSLRHKRVLVDPAGNPIVRMQQKILTAHKRWQVFRGESSDPKDLLFSAKKSSLLQIKTQLDVFLASNTSETASDFTIKGSYFERSCTIYAGDSNTIIAQMKKIHNAESVLLGMETFGVTVYPNVDYAYVTALIVILEEINKDRKD